MEDRYCGVTASLTLVTMAALLVAFGALARRRDLGGQLLALESRLERLQQNKEALEEKLRWVESRYAHTRSISRRLNEALYEEKARNEALARKLRQTPASDLPSPPGRAGRGEGVPSSENRSAVDLD